MRRPGLDGGGWPDPTTETLLHAALDPPPSAAAAWARVRSRIDLASEKQTDHTRLLPLVLMNLGSDRIGDSAGLKNLHRSMWRQNRLHLHHAPRWLDPLEGRVPVLILKGMAMVPAYPDLGCRPMGDVDVLVPRDRMGLALDLLVAAGWNRPSSPPLPRSLRAMHAVPLTHPDGGHIDVHHVPGVPFMRPPWERDPATGFWSSAREGELAGRPVFLLAPEDLLVTTIVHGLTDIATTSSRWVADSVLLLRHRQPDWDRLVARAEHHRVLLPVRSALRLLVDAFDVAVPADTMHDLWTRPVRVGDRRRFARLTEQASSRLPLPPPVVWRMNRLRTARGRIGAVAALPAMACETLAVEHARQVPGAAWDRVVNRSRRHRARL